MKNLNNLQGTRQICTTTLLLMLLFLNFSTQAQQFLTDYGTPQNDWGYSGLALENTSNTDQFVVVGKMENAVAGSIANDDIYFSRLDINGNILPSTKLIGTTNWEKGNFIEKVFNPLTDLHTGYVVTGSTHNGNPNERDLLITLTDLTGNVICSRAFGDPNDDEVGFSVIQDEDGNFVATGYKINNTTSVESVYTVKMDFNCGLIWSNSYESPAIIHAYSICAANNIVDIAGNVYSQAYALTGKMDQDIFIILLDKNGLVINEYRYDFNFGTNNEEIGYCIQQDFDGGFVVTGETVPFGTAIPTGTKKIFVHKTDMLLNYNWLHEYDMPSSEVEYGKYIHLVYADPSQTTPNGYILTGRTNRNIVEFPDNSTGDAFLLRLDMTGNPVWSNTYRNNTYKASHGNRVDVGYLMQTPSFFVSGHSLREDNTGSVPQFDYDVLAFSTDMNGSLATTSNDCYTQIPTTIIPMQGPNIVMNSIVVPNNLSFDPNIDDIPSQELQLFCEGCINISYTDLGNYHADCDEMIDSTNPVFGGLSPNCSSCTWVYQATNLPVVFPIDMSTYPSNSSFVLTCIDVTNCCETILTIETGCCDDTCPTGWLGVNYIDPCCVELDLEVTDNCHTFKKIITEIITPGVNYSSIGLGAPYTSSWMGSSIDPQTIAFTPITPTTGSFPNLVKLCVENIGGIMPQQMDVHYVVCSSTGLDSIACTESIYLQCQPITPAPCLDIKSDSIYCNAVGDYFLDFCVTNNSSATCMMTDLNLWVTAPMTITPSAFTGLSIAPGDCFCGTLAIGSTAIGGAISGDPLEIFFSSSCCPNDVATLNTVLPDCDDCAVSSVDLGTGTGITSAGTDASWTVIADPIVSTIEPRPADIIAPYPSWSPPFAGTEWMSAIPSTTGGPMGDYVFERCFCMGDVIVDPYLELNVLADDIAQICLNGNPIGIANSSVTPTVISTSNPSFFQTGKNCIQVKLTNLDNNLMGINIAGFVSATEGLQQDNCCEDPAKITGFKWNDINGDGIWQTFEPAIPGWTILLSNGDVAITDATGKYEFCVDAGTYQVAEELNPDWAQTFPTSVGAYHTVTVDWGDVLTDINFGNHELCPTTVILADDVYLPGTNIIIQADQTFTSGQHNIAGQNNTSGSIIYQAGQNISLEAGFEIEIGVEFDALIQTCSSTALQQEADNKAIDTKTESVEKDQ